MSEITEVLKYILPSVIVLICVWVLVHKFLKNWENQRKQETIRLIKKNTLPLRLQAYERMTLFLERITIDSLLIREKDNELDSREFHQKLLQAVRSEYEYNLTQQIYLSPESWQIVKNAKEGVVKMINRAAFEVKPEEPAIELSKKIIDLQMEIESSPTRAALEFINREVNSILS